MFFRTYKKKTDRKLCTEEMLNTAQQLLEAGMSKRKAAKQLGISEATLRKRLSKVITLACGENCFPIFNLLSTIGILYFL